MKEMKKNIIFFGAVLVALLMVVSSASAVTITQSNKSLEPDAVIESYGSQVDPDINIGLDKLSILYESLQYIDNPDVLSLVQAIIDEIEEDGSATTRDVEQIEEDLGIFFPVHVGRINSGGATGGPLLAFPGGILANVFPTVYWGPSVVVCWSGLTDDSCPAKTWINLRLIHQGNHQGFVIGFLGWLSMGPYGPWMLPVYNVIGTGALIIVIPGEGCTSAASLQSSPAPQTQPSAEPISATTQELVGSTTISKQNTIN